MHVRVDCERANPCVTHCQHVCLFTHPPTQPSDGPAPAGGGGGGSVFAVDPDFEQRSAALTRGLDDCHSLAEVLKIEVAKCQSMIQNKQGSSC